jgi:hypothetical protein
MQLKDVMEPKTVPFECWSGNCDQARRRRWRSLACTNGIENMVGMVRQ